MPYTLTDEQFLLVYEALELNATFVGYADATQSLILSHNAWDAIKDLMPDTDVTPSTDQTQESTADPSEPDQPSSDLPEQTEGRSVRRAYQPPMRQPARRNPERS
jgi:hypothetical protein